MSEDKKGAGCPLSMTTGATNIQSGMPLWAGLPCVSYCAILTSMRLGLSSAFLGSVTVSTPSAIRASIAASSTPSGKAKLLLKEGVATSRTM